MTKKGNNILQVPDLSFSLISLPDPHLDTTELIGSNQKKLLIVCEEEEDHATNINLLEKILEAVQFNLKELYV